MLSNNTHHPSLTLTKEKVSTQEICANAIDGSHEYQTGGYAIQCSGLIYTIGIKAGCRLTKTYHVWKHLTL